MKLELKLSNGWIEATWYTENISLVTSERIIKLDGEDKTEIEEEKVITRVNIHCESFSGNPEHITMLRAKAYEYKTDLDEKVITECISSFELPTAEQLLEERNSTKLRDAYAYLASTAWYIERFNDPSSGKAIPQEVLDKRAEARLIINELI